MFTHTLKNLAVKTQTPLKLTWSFFAILVIIRFMEMLSINTSLDTTDISNYLAGVQFDFLFASIAGVFLIALFALLSQKFHNLGVGLSVFAIVVGAMLTWSLSEYFITTQIPLDHSIFVYPLNEVLHITSSSVSFSYAMMLKGLFVAGISIATPLFLLKKIKLKNTSMLVGAAPILLFLLIFNNITPDIARFERNRGFYQQINKTTFFAKSILFHLGKDEIENMDNINYITREYHELRSDLRFKDANYPFMRKHDEEDVLGEYFEFSEDKPNIVFIIVENLSRGFSGPGAHWGSFTPFLDSLADHSLYWTHFLATSERTFNVLPSALGSLPYADKGFMTLIEEQKAYPDFVSLNDILDRAGYFRSFFYGGWSYFDFMSVFLEAAGLDYMLDELGFGESFEKMPELDEGYSWGYPDHALFERSMKSIDSLNTQPRFDLFLTLSMHEPYTPPNPDYWVNAFRRHLQENKNPALHQRQYQSAELLLSTTLYTDNAIRQAIKDYQKRPGFENTLFFIFGDHHAPLADLNPLQKYHVPFMIYSPMLTTSKKFHGVSSVADITPTLSAMLRDNYNLMVPGDVHWLGQNLDTYKGFRSRNFIPFMRVNRNINELLWDDYFFSENRLFKVEENMELTLINNPGKRHELERGLEYFKRLNTFVCKENRIYKSNSTSPW